MDKARERNDRKADVLVPAQRGHILVEWEITL